MAEPPAPPDVLLDRFGPHPAYAPPGGWQDESRHPPERLVKTHCCFCGQQCGIQLKVRGNQVIGFEPWEEFPFNHGMLCPKGVKRYLQGGHPDRLLDPLLRTPQGFRAVSWDQALDFTAKRLREVQEKYGKDALAIFGGASLISEKSYLLGKFARVALGTRHIDYNGRLCMVSAGTAYKLAFGVDRSPLPWSITRSPNELPGICKQIARELREQYTLGYAPSNLGHGGGFRTIRVVARAPGHSKLIVRAREGYLAPNDSASTPMQP